MRYVRMGLVVGLVVGGLMLSLAVAAEEKALTGNTMEIKVGQEIARTLDQVKADKFAYGPKQVVSGTKTTIYLPYGNTKGVYNEVQGGLTDPSAGGTALFYSSTGEQNALLTFKLHFDKAISSFGFYAGWTELGLQDKVVAGFEYSVDGKAWKPIREVNAEEAKKANGVVEPFVPAFKADGLNTQDLYIRCYSRDPSDPAAGGPGRWFKLRTSGDPSWGDAATTFFACQLQVWVTAAEPAAAAPAAPKVEEKK